MIGRIIAGHNYYEGCHIEADQVSYLQGQRLSSRSADMYPFNGIQGDELTTILKRNRTGTNAALQTAQSKQAIL